MKVKFNKLNHQFSQIKIGLEQRLSSLFENSSFINGPDVARFEDNFSKYIGSKYSVGVSNGTDALKLAALSLGYKHDVAIFIPANTFISTILGMQEAIPNAEINLIDCNDEYVIDTDILEKQVSVNSKKYKIIVPVHLYGHSCNINEISRIATKYSCDIIEDSSQAHGTEDENNDIVGKNSNLSCFSLYPGKNLGAFGDAGIITTNNKKCYENILMTRNLGSKEKYKHEILGFNHRLDSIQAIVLDEKLKFLDKWNNQRIEIASKFLNGIKNPKVILPQKASYCKKHTYHIFCIRITNRQDLMKYLQNNDIEYNIHYPIPIEKMKMYEYLNAYNPKTRIFSDQILSLPIHPFMTEEESDYVIDKINKF